jgi:hypothetical protein
LSVRVVLARKWWFNLLPCDLIWCFMVPQTIIYTAAYQREARTREEEDQGGEWWPVLSERWEFSIWFTCISCTMQCQEVTTQAKSLVTLKKQDMLRYETFHNKFAKGVTCHCAHVPLCTYGVIWRNFTPSSKRNKTMHAMKTTPHSK